MSPALRLVLFGPPGAGKGTQAHLLCEQLKLAHVSSGDLFRKNLREGTPLGLRAAEYMKQGLLVPDEFTVDIILDMVLSMDADDGFLLDGFPRNPNQARELEEALEKRSRQLDRVVHIEVPEEELVRRVAGRRVCRDCQAPHAVHQADTEKKCDHCGGELYQRDDDNEVAVRKRIEIYREETVPVLEFYRQRDLLLAVQGVDTVDGVNRQILSKLGQT